MSIDSRVFYNADYGCRLIEHGYSRTAVVIGCTRVRSSAEPRPVAAYLPYRMTRFASPCLSQRSILVVPESRITRLSLQHGIGTLPVYPAIVRILLPFASPQRNV